MLVDDPDALDKGIARVERALTARGRTRYAATSKGSERGVVPGSSRTKVAQQLEAFTDDVGWVLCDVAIEDAAKGFTHASKR